MSNCNAIHRRVTSCAITIKNATVSLSVPPPTLPLLHLRVSNEASRLFLRSSTAAVRALCSCALFARRASAASELRRALSSSATKCLPVAAFTEEKQIKKRRIEKIHTTEAVQISNNTEGLGQNQHGALPPSTKKRAHTPINHTPSTKKNQHQRDEKKYNLKHSSES